MKFSQWMTTSLAVCTMMSQASAFEIEQDSGQLVVTFNANAQDINYTYRLPSGCDAKVKVSKTASKLALSHLGHCKNGAVLSVEFPLRETLKAYLGAGRIEVHNAEQGERFFNRLFVKAEVGMASVPSLSGWKLVENNYIGRSYEKTVNQSAESQAEFIVNSGVVEVTN